MFNLRSFVPALGLLFLAIGHAAAAALPPFYDRVAVSSSTIGTGTLTLGGAISGPYQSFAAAGVANASTLRYIIVDGNAWEIGHGVYTSSGATLTRSVDESSNSGVAVSLDGSETVFLAPVSFDFNSLAAIGRTTVGDANTTISSSAVLVVTSTTLTAPRTWTLPAASAVSAGYTITVLDEAGGVTATNTIAVTPNGTDTINGSNSATNSTLACPYGAVTLESNGSNGWGVRGNILICSGSPQGLAFLANANTFTKGQAVTPTAGGTQSAGGTYTPDFSASNSVTLTFGAGNLTIANPTNIKAGQSYNISLTQDATGSRTVTWGADFKWAGGTAPTLSTAASAKDIISCWADTATTLNCTLAIKGAA